MDETDAQAEIAALREEILSMGAHAREADALRAENKQLRMELDDVRFHAQRVITAASEMVFALGATQTIGEEDEVGHRP